MPLSSFHTHDQAVRNSSHFGIMYLQIPKPLSIRLPVGDAATIIFCSPIFVMIFSHILLREHCGIYRFIVIGFLMIGVILIAKPPFLNKILLPNNDNTQLQSSIQNQDMVGYGAALAGTLLTASNFVCMRR